MITIVTVNYNAYDFLGLLVESLEWSSSQTTNLIVIDNSKPTQTLNRPKIKQFFMPTNIGHGRGLNHGILKTFELFPKTDYIMFLDSDCHFLNQGWEEAFIKQMKTFDMVAGKGVPSKPIRPACLFMKRAIAKTDWSDSNGYRGNRVTPGGYDVAIKAYYKILADNKKIGFLEHATNHYGTLNGEEWLVDGKPFVYHHWHGSHLRERAEDFPGKDLFADKAMLFSKIPWRMTL